MVQIVASRCFRQLAAFRRSRCSRPNCLVSSSACLHRHGYSGESGCKLVYRPLILPSHVALVRLVRYTCVRHRSASMLLIDNMHRFAGTVKVADSASTYTNNRAKSCARSAYSDTQHTAAHAPNVAILDKLIAVFASKSPTEWRKLIAHSKQWPQLSGSVLARCTIVHCTACVASSHALAPSHVAMHLQCPV